MAGFYLDCKEVIHVEVKKCERRKPPEYKKFSLDPQITSFEMLQGILGKAFQIRRGSEYTLNYVARSIGGEEIHLSMLSDWDMDAAFQSAADPCLRLRMDVKPSDQDLEDWEVIAPADVPKHGILHPPEKVSLLGAITSNISSHMGRTMSSMQRAIGRKHSEEMFKPVKPPMSDKEFHGYLDSAGYMVKPREFRLSVYQGGIDSALRPVAWRHLLCIFPENLSGRERFDYLKRKEREYYSLRDEWKERFDRGSTTEEVKHVALMVKKDVLRTDRTHRMFAGGDDNNLNKNVLSLFNILVTYALTHPDASYCQGMSDLASPLLVIQKDEAQAYICFCSLMSRLRHNFSADGMAMMTQFRHLAQLLRVHDPAFHDYLQSINAHDLFFCYRWLLLQLKREFPFEDALYMLEVMWSTLPLTPPKNDLPLTDPHYSVRFLSSSPSSPSFSFQQSIYTKLLAMRCSSRARDLALASCSSEDCQAAEEGIQHVDNTSACTTTSLKNHQGIEYAQVDNAVTGCLNQRPDNLNQVLHENGVTGCVCQRPDNINEMLHEKTLSLPTDERVCLSQRSLDDENQNVLEQSLRDLSESVSDTLSSISQALQEDRLSVQSDQHVCLRQKPLDFVESHFRELSESLSVGQRPNRRGVNQDIEESSETDNSFVNISIEVGTADLPADGDPRGSCSPFQDVYEEDLFTLSLDSEPACSEGPARTEGEDEGYSGLSGSRKGLPACPKPPMANMTPCPHLSPEPNGNRQEYMGGRSDSGVSDSYSGGRGIPCSTPENRLHLSQAGLPPPHQFGNGNPFLMFSCLTLLLQHREHIMSSQMEYEDVAMFFDKLVRQHNVHKVLQQARQLYCHYLLSHRSHADCQEYTLSL